MSTNPTQTTAAPEQDKSATPCAATPETDASKKVETAVVEPKAEDKK